MGIHVSSGGIVGTLEYTGSSFTNVNVSSGGEVKELKVRHVPLESEDVDLERPIPKHIPLQPGNVASFTISVRAKDSLIFTPTKYRLQFNVAFHFGEQEMLHVTSISHSVTVRAPAKSVLIGAGVGSIAGFFARFLANPTIVNSATDGFLKFALSIILGLVAVVFMSRKSEKQSFISIEDFWGGMVIGFLVAYSGAEAIGDVMNVAKGANK